MPSHNESLNPFKPGTNYCLPPLFLPSISFSFPPLSFILVPLLLSLPSFPLSLPPSLPSFPLSFLAFLLLLLIPNQFSVFVTPREAEEVGDPIPAFPRSLEDSGPGTAVVIVQEEKYLESELPAELQIKNRTYSSKFIDAYIKYVILEVGTSTIN